VGGDVPQHQLAVLTAPSNDVGIGWTELETVDVVWRLQQQLDRQNMWLSIVRFTGKSKPAQY